MAKKIEFGYGQYVEGGMARNVVISDIQTDESIVVQRADVDDLILALHRIVEDM